MKPNIEETKSFIKRVMALIGQEITDETVTQMAHKINTTCWKYDK